MDLKDEGGLFGTPGSLFGLPVVTPAQYSRGAAGEGGYAKQGVLAGAYAPPLKGEWPEVADRAKTSGPKPLIQLSFAVLPAAPGKRPPLAYASIANESFAIRRSGRWAKGLNAKDRRPQTHG